MKTGEKRVGLKMGLWRKRNLKVLSVILLSVLAVGNTLVMDKAKAQTRRIYPSALEVQKFMNYLNNKGRSSDTASPKEHLRTFCNLDRLKPSVA